MIDSPRTSSLYRTTLSCSEGWRFTTGGTGGIVVTIRLPHSRNPCDSPTPGHSCRTEWRRVVCEERLLNLRKEGDRRSHTPFGDDAGNQLDRGECVRPMDNHHAGRCAVRVQPYPADYVSYLGCTMGCGLPARHQRTPNLSLHIRQGLCTYPQTNRTMALPVQDGRHMQKHRSAASTHSVPQCPLPIANP